MPEPLGPMTATNSPSPTSRDTPLRLRRWSCRPDRICAGSVRITWRIFLSKRKMVVFWGFILLGAWVAVGARIAAHFQVDGICACAARADKKGNTCGFPLLANQPHSLQGALRAQGSVTLFGCHPVAAATGRGLIATATGQGGSFALHVVKGEWGWQWVGVTPLYARSAS